MSNIKLHYVPQPVQDLATNAQKSNNKFHQDTYVLRLESIRDFCNNVINKIMTKKEAKGEV
jgi:hypothetical protein